MGRKKTGLGRSVRKVKKNKIVRASLPAERETEREGVRHQSMERLSQEAEKERCVKWVSENKRGRSVRSGGDRDRKRLRKDAGDRTVSPVRKSSTIIVLIARCTLIFIQGGNDLQSDALKRSSSMRPGGDGGVTYRDILCGTMLVSGNEGTERESRKRLANRQRMSRSRRSMHMQLRLAGRHYVPDYEFSQHPSVDIGKMNVVCQFCRALKFRHETPGMCCANERVRLPELRDPPEPLASHNATRQIRTLFAILLTTCFPSNPRDLWEKFKDYMSEDILHRKRQSNLDMEISFSSEIYNEALLSIEEICLTSVNKKLKQLGMSGPIRSAEVQDRDLSRETEFDVEQLRQATCNKKLSPEGDGQWRCTTCQICYVDFKWVLKIRMIVTDATQDIWCSAFGSVSQEILPLLD